MEESRACRELGSDGRTQSRGPCAELWYSLASPYQISHLGYLEEEIRPEKPDDFRNITEALSRGLSRSMIRAKVRYLDNLDIITSYT